MRAKLLATFLVLILGALVVVVAQTRDEPTELVEPTITEIATGAPPTVTVSVSNFPDPQNVAGTVNVGNLPAVQPVSGTVSVGNLSAVQQVAGTVAVSNLGPPAGPSYKVVEVPIIATTQNCGSQTKYISDPFDVAGWSSFSFIVVFSDGSSITNPSGWIQYRHSAAHDFPTRIWGTTEPGWPMGTPIRGTEARILTRCGTADAEPGGTHFSIFLTK